IPSRTAPLYAVWVDMDELKAEGDGIPGDIVTDEMLVVLREINAKRCRSGASATGGSATGVATPAIGRRTRGGREEARPPAWSLRGIAAIHENGLSRHPPAIGDEEADVGDDVLDVGQAGLGELREGGGTLVVGDRVGTLGR